MSSLGKKGKAAQIKRYGGKAGYKVEMGRRWAIGRARKGKKV